MSIQSNHFLNSPETLVLDSLKGVCDAAPHLALDPDNKIVYVRDQDRDKVALVCGGGAGHEPAHSGFVGQGMLTAAVCGNVFASPNASQVRRSIDLVENNKGTVIIVKNYTGDILNFGLAKEQYIANHPSRSENLRFVVVADDVAVGRSQGKIVGRRGLAGTVLVYKIAGALAHRGASLDDVYRIAIWVSQNVGTIGVSLGHVHIPGANGTGSDFSKSELEIGMGIHNETGNNRISPTPPLSELVEQLLQFLTSASDPDRSFLEIKKGGSVVLLVNNLGSVSELELTAIVAETRKQVDEKGYKIARVLAGTFMTSLNMPGFSITLLRLPSGEDAMIPKPEEVIALLDEKPQVPGWGWSPATPPLPLGVQIVKGGTVGAKQGNAVQLEAQNPHLFVSAIRNAANSLIAAELEITRMDTIAGDGDAGLTLKAGAQGVLSKLDQGVISGDNIVVSLIAISQVGEEKMGGTSGALYSIFFSALAQGLQAQSIKEGSVVTNEHWVSALSLALRKFYTYTRARRPSRTLVDPLAAFIEALEKSGGEDFGGAVQLAAQAAEETRHVEAKAGRSAYVQSEHLQKETIPDPGAWGVKTILESLRI